METSELKYGSKVVASCWNDWLLFNIVYEKPLTVIEIHEHDSDDCAVSHLRKANLLVILYPYKDGREEMTMPVLNKGTTWVFWFESAPKSTVTKKRTESGLSCSTLTCHQSILLSFSDLPIIRSLRIQPPPETFGGNIHSLCWKWMNEKRLYSQARQFGTAFCQWQ